MEICDLPQVQRPDNEIDPSPWLILHISDQLVSDQLSLRYSLRYSHGKL
jgi:hypothetical protein